MRRSRAAYRARFARPASRLRRTAGPPRPEARASSRSRSAGSRRRAPRTASGWRRTSARDVLLVPEREVEQIPRATPGPAQEALGLCAVEEVGLTAEGGDGRACRLAGG